MTASRAPATSLRPGAASHGQGALRQGEALLGGPDIDQVQRRGLGALGEGPLDRLAVDRHHPLEPLALGKGHHETGKGRFEGLRVEQAEHPAEGIVARNAVFQVQHLAQHILLGLAEVGHVRAALRAAENRRQGNEQQLQKIVPRVARTGILYSLENRNKTSHGPLHTKERPSEAKSSHKAILHKYSYAIPLLRMGLQRVQGGLDFPALMIESGQGASGGRFMVEDRGDQPLEYPS